MIVVALIVLAMSWGSIQRGRQLAAIDACRDGDRIEDARQLAQAFAATWGPRSTFVVDAINAGRGPIEARIELCRAGKHLRLLAAMLQDESLTSVQRGLLCAALSELWPDDGTGPAVTSSVSSWALGPEAEPALAEPALRLMVAMGASDAEENLARGASDARLSPERARSIALGLGHVIESHSNGIKYLLVALGGAHRSELLGLEPLADVVRNQAMTTDVDQLFLLLDKPDSLMLGLAGLAGKRVQLSDTDEKLRQALVAKLQPLLTEDAEDAALAAALQVVRRQRLIECRTQVIELLFRLAKRRPQQLPPDDLAELLGRSLVHTTTPAATAAAEEMVNGLRMALDRDATRVLATVALSRVQEPSLAALMLALDDLAVRTDTPACADALAILVGNVYGRSDMVEAGRKMGWARLMADNRRKRARVEGMRLWLKEHGDETTVRSEKDVINQNKAQLNTMRDELRGMQESSEPLPIGMTKAKLDELANQVQLMLNMVLKASSGI